MRLSFGGRERESLSEEVGSLSARGPGRGWETMEEKCLLSPGHQSWFGYQRTGLSTEGILTNECKDDLAEWRAGREPDGAPKTQRSDTDESLPPPPTHEGQELD